MFARRPDERRPDTAIASRDKSLPELFQPPRVLYNVSFPSFDAVSDPIKFYRPLERFNESERSADAVLPARRHVTVTTNRNDAFTGIPNGVINTRSPEPWSTKQEEEEEPWSSPCMGWEALLTIDVEECQQICDG